MIVAAFVLGGLFFLGILCMILNAAFDWSERKQLKYQIEECENELLKLRERMGKFDNFEYRFTILEDQVNGLTEVATDEPDE